MWSLPADVFHTKVALRLLSIKAFILLVVISSSIQGAVAENFGIRITLQPLKDTYIDLSKAELNFGASSELKVAGGSNAVTSYLVFDLSSLPAGVPVLAAELKLFLIGKGSEATSSVSVHRLIDTEWDELRVNSQNAPQYVSIATYVNDIVARVRTWYKWTVSADVQSALEEGKTQIGWALVSRLAGSGVDVFGSRDSFSTPQLEIILAAKDDSPPRILSVELGPVVEGVGSAEVRLGAVDDLSGIANATLEYSLDNVTWSNQTMNPREDLLVGILPNGPPETVVWYRVTVKDAAGNSVSSSVFYFVIGRPLSYQALLNLYEDLLSRFDELLVNYSTTLHKLELSEEEVKAALQLYESVRIRIANANATVAALSEQYDLLNSAYASLQTQYQSLRTTFAQANEVYTLRERRLTVIAAVGTASLFLIIELARRLRNKSLLLHSRSS